MVQKTIIVLGILFLTAANILRPGKFTKNLFIKRFSQSIFLMLLIISVLFSITQAAVIFNYFCPIGGIVAFTKYFTTNMTLYQRIINPISYVIAAIVLASAIFGPVFCGWLCPFGALQDMVCNLTSRLQIKQFKKFFAKHDKNFKKLRIATFFSAIILTIINKVIFLDYINPLRAFADLFQNKYSLMGLLVLIIILFLAANSVSRPWCRYLCPFGMFLGVFNRMRLFTVKRNEHSCINCKRCDNACPVGVKISESSEVRDFWCITCMQCSSKSSCPVKDTVVLSRQSKTAEKGYALIASTALIAVMTLSLYSIISAHSNSRLNGMPSVVSENSMNEYEFEAHGTDEYNERINKISETVDNDPEDDIEPIEGKYDDESLENNVLEKQNMPAQKNNTPENTGNNNTNGADKKHTDSTDNKNNNIKNINTKESSESVQVKKETQNENSEKQTASNTSNVETAKDNTEPNNDAGVLEKGYKDGIYTAMVKGFANGMKVQMKIVSGKITEINIIEHNETPGFFERVFDILPGKIIEKQSWDVDIVSGATMTSKGVISAAKQMMEDAAK